MNLRKLKFALRYPIILAFIFVAVKQNAALPMAPPAHAPFPRHAMGNLPVNDVNPNFVQGYRGPGSVQEQLAVSQSRVNSLLGTLQPGPPQIPMHLPPPMQAQHHPAPVIIQQVLERR